MDSILHPTTDFEELENRLAASRAQLRDLATMGAVITRIQEIDAVLSVTMDMAIPLVHGEVGLILIDENGSLKPHVSWGVGEEFIKSIHYKDDLDLVTYCYRQREPVMLSNLNLRFDNGMEVDSVVAVPMQTREHCLGVMVIINKTDGSGYEEDDIEVLEMLLNFVAVAIENSNLVAEKLARQRVEQEMLIARQVQETILPRDDVFFEGAEIGAVYFPFREVGGDFFEILKIDDRQFLVVLGDVSNHGVPAALVMAAVSGVIKSIVSTSPEIAVSELAQRVNTTLVDQIIKDRDMFVTLFFAHFDLTAQQMIYTNAGHQPGLFWNARRNQIEHLSTGGPIIGQFPGIAFEQETRILTSGDRLLLYTDGLTEAEDTECNLFGRERVEEVFAGEIELTPKRFCLRMKECVDQYSRGADDDSRDDFTVLQVKVS
jgi:sigma-B regulation protein RsbU (phosphoserine phosphatase)